MAMRVRFVRVCTKIAARLALIQGETYVVAKILGIDAITAKELAKVL